MTDYRDHIMSLPRVRERQKFTGSHGCVSRARAYREKKKSIPEELTPEEVREVMDALREMGTGKEGKP